MANKASFSDKSKVVQVGFFELMKMGLTKNTEWPDSEVFLDFIYWSRQIIGIFTGIIWGLLPLTGFLGLALFAVTSCCYVYLYCSVQIDEAELEEYGGIWEVIKEGFMTNFASFLVTYIITYSSYHFDENFVRITS